MILQPPSPYHLQSTPTSDLSTPCGQSRLPKNHEPPTQTLKSPLIYNLLTGKTLYRGGKSFQNTEFIYRNSINWFYIVVRGGKSNSALMGVEESGP